MPANTPQQVTMRHLSLLARAALALAVCACTDEQPAADTLASGPDPAYESQLFRKVLRNLTAPQYLAIKGDWPHDYGDANMFGTGLMYRYGKAGGNALQLDLARQCQQHDVRVLAAANGDLAELMRSMEDVLMAALGVVEAQAHEPDAAALKQLDTMLDVVNTVSRALNYYPESMSVGQFGLQTYGPSTINAMLALVNLEYALQVGGARRDERLKDGLEILARGRQQGWLKDKGYYKFSSKRSGLYLYPQVSQMIALLRAHQLSGKQLYLDQARALHKAMQPLKIKGQGRYRSPYSQQEMGAKSDDYTTLSSQNYTLMALALLHRFSGDQAVKQEIVDILAFIRTRMLAPDGRVLHHWIDGRLVLAGEPVDYCSGCNLQLLYIIWRLDELMKPIK